MSDWYSEAREADGRTDEGVMAEIRLRADAEPLPEYTESWDEETVYLERSAYATAEEAFAAYRRLALESFGMSESDIEGQVAEAVTVPSHDADESTHVFDGECPDCQLTDVWMIAP